MFVVFYTYNTHNIRRINKSSLAEFKYNLSLELWEDMFNEKDVINIFNSFLKYIFKIFLLPFSNNKKNNGIIKKDIRLITPHISILFCLKKDLYLFTKNFKNLKLMNCYK